MRTATSLVADGTRHCSAYHSIVTKLEAKATFCFTRIAEENENNKAQLFRLSQYSYQVKAMVTFRFAETKEVSAQETKKRRKRRTLKNEELHRDGAVPIDNETECAAEVEKVQLTHRRKN